MNCDAMPRRIAALALVLFLVGCQGESAGPGPSSHGADLRGSAIGGDFALVDKTGKTVRWNDFAGKYRIVYFGYPFRPNVLPTHFQPKTQEQKLHSAKHPAEAKTIQPIFITVDPERDTPEVVGEFAAAFSPALIGLTGTPALIEDAKAAFKVYSSKGAMQPGGGYLVDHTNITYLFDQAGKPLGTLPTDKGPQAVADEIARWVR